MKLGDAVCRLVDMEQLIVQGDVPASDFDLDDLRGRDVHVEVELPPGQVEPFRGKITGVSPELDDGKFSVRATVKNRRADGSWILRPGLRGRMTFNGADQPLQEQPPKGN